MNAPDCWEMERIKRRLDRFASLIGPVRAVALIGSPSASDIEGQLRVEGLENLLAASGVALRPAAFAQGAAAIWLGDAPEELQGLLRCGGPPPDRLLVWPRPEQVARTSDVLNGWDGPPPILCSPIGAPGGTDGSHLQVHALPDPAHALWGLLDHHPGGGGLLELPEGGWDDLLPASRLEMLRRSAATGRGPRLGRFGPGLRRVARRRVLEAARQVVTTHAAVSGTRVGGSILAALLGRGFRAAPAGGRDGAERVAAYWTGWRTVLAAP